MESSSNQSNDKSKQQQNQKGWTYGWDESKRVFLCMIYATLVNIRSKSARRKEAMKRFKDVFPELHWYPSDATFMRKLDMVWKETETGPDTPNSYGKPEPYDDRREMIEHTKTVRTPEMIKTVQEKLDENPYRSSNSIAKELNVSRHSAQMIVKKDLGYTKWKLTVCQYLPSSSWEKRLKASSLFIEKLMWFPKWLARVWWTDEKHFILDHTHNHRNDGYYSKFRPSHDKLAVSKKPYPKKVTILSAVNMKYGMISVCEWLDEKGNRINVTAANYQSAFDLIVCEIKRRVGNEKEFKKQVWHQDGASAHNATATIELIKYHFGNNYIATKPNEGDGLFWPPYSCEMNVLDRCIWGILEDRVNKRKYDTVWELQDAVLDEANKMDQDRELLARCVGEFRDVCQAVYESEGKNIDFKRWKRERAKAEAGLLDDGLGWNEPDNQENQENRDYLNISID